MKSENRSYLPRLDYVRGLAAWWVVMHHATAYFPLAAAVPTFWPGSMDPFLVFASQGWLAVGLFLMISGFSLGRGLHGREIRWRGYLAARWLRVAPLYLILLFLGTVAYKATPSLAEFGAALTLLPIPEAYSPGAWMGVTWSVRIEFLLYFTIPALVVLARVVPLKRIVGMAPIMVVLVFWFLFLTGAESESVLYWQPPGRMVEFSVGFFLGYFGVKIGPAWQRAFGLLAILGFCGLAFHLNRLGGFTELTTTARLFSFVANIALATCVLLWAQNRKPLRPRLVDSIGRALGTWSYSTYMWHVIVITLMVVPLWTRLGAAGWEMYPAMLMGLVVAVGVTVLISWLSFSMIESPFLALRPKYVVVPDLTVRRSPSSPALSQRGPLSSDDVTLTHPNGRSWPRASPPNGDDASSRTGESRRPA